MSKKLFASILTAILSPILLQAGDQVKDTLGFAKSVSRTPAALLSSEVSGVRVSSIDGSLGGVSSVTVRGLNTLRGDSQPVWIVDGAVLTTSAFDNRDLFFKSDYSGRAYTAPKNNLGWLGVYEIESIRVIKDMSEAARYGVLGANGVIIINTRKATEGDLNVHINSNAGVEFLPKVGDAFRSGFFHNHDVGIDGKIGSNSNYKIAGFLRSNDGTVQREQDRSLGLAVAFETRANKRFKFGLNSILNYDKASSSYGTNYIGATSAMIVSRYPTSFIVDTVNGWVKDYDDDSEAMRSTSSVYLQIDFLPGLYFKASGGVDYQNSNRIIWFGNGTAFGHEVNGAAGVLNNSLLNYNSRGELSFTRNFAVNHHLELNAAVEFMGYFNRTNAMCASSFDLPYLRGKGMSASTGGKRIRKFARPYNDLGGVVLLNYDYKKMFGLQGTFRADYDMKYRTEPLLSPAGSAFIDLKKIFFPKGKAVSGLKLTGGWGMAARETDLPFEYLNAWMLNLPTIESKSEYYYNGLNILRSKEYNASVTLGFLSDRFTLGAKYYGKTTDDALNVMSDLKILNNLYEQAADWTPVQERHTTISNDGFEFDLELGLVRTKLVQWTVSANFARNVNRIVSIDEKDVTAANITKGAYLAAQQEGESVSGNCIPKMHGGLETSLGVGKFTFDLKMDGAADFYILNANNILKRQENAFTDSDFERGDFLRLDHIGAAYDIPLKSKRIKQLRVSASGHNLFTFTKYSGWNPDVNSYGISVRSAGVDYGSYPLARTFVFGVNLKF